MRIFDLITPLSYWALLAIWTAILLIYLRHIRHRAALGAAVVTLLIVLMIDAFRTLFESLYFGLHFNSIFGILPAWISEITGRPELIAIPKVINILAGSIILIVLLHNWLPRQVAERRRAETALRRSETRFQDFAEFGSDWLWEMDRDLRFCYFSDRLIDVTGLSREKYIGKTRQELGQGSISDAAWQQHLADLKARRPFRNFRYTHVTGDGREFYWSISGKPLFDAAGNFEGYRGTGTDLTEQKRAEMDLRKSEARLWESQRIARIGTWEYDEVGQHLLWASDEALRILNGGDTPDLLEWDDHLARIHSDDRQRVLATLEDRRETPRPSETAYRILDDAGGIHHLLVIAEPVLGRDDQLASYRGTVQDITEVAEIEARLRHSQKMEAVGQLTGGVAHDFNNLLGVILGNAELLAERGNSDDPQLAAMIRAAEHGAELTQRLLAFSRRQALQPQSIDLDRLIATLRDLLKHSLGETIEVEAVATAGLWTCNVDPGQIESAILNLAINARDAMPHGGKLTIGTANVSLDDEYAAAQAEVKPGEYVMLTVSDNGEGMPPDVLEHVFEPFFTTKVQGRGTGMGLPMVFGFAKQSGGDVTIHSEVGQGTTVKLYLPRSSQPPLAKAVTEASTGGQAQGESVLVVEDDADVNNLAVALLEVYGYRVFAASDGRKALEILRDGHEIDLLFTDVLLPGGLTGPQLAEKARDLRPNMKVLFMSGHTHDTPIQEGPQDDGPHILRKPFRKAELAQEVRAALDGARP